MMTEGCITPAAGVIACNPSSFPVRRVRYCPTCRCNRRFAGLLYVWYDATWTCCHCGDSWAGGERMQRPFLKGWRRRAIEQAEKIVARASQYSDADRQAWFDAQTGE